jgi:response regulator of citrate/malate metabolism
MASEKGRGVVDRPKRDVIGGVTLEQIEAAIKSVRGLPDRPKGVFTRNEMAAAIGLSESSTNRYLRLAIRAGDVEYAGKIRVVDITGHAQPTHAYRVNKGKKAAK